MKWTHHDEKITHSIKKKFISFYVLCMRMYVTVSGSLRERSVYINFQFVFFFFATNFGKKCVNRVNIRTKKRMFTVHLIILKANKKIIFHQIFMSRIGMDKLKQSKYIIFRCTHTHINSSIHLFTYIECDGLVLSIIIKCIYILIFYKWNWICFAPLYIDCLLIFILYTRLLLFHVIFIRLSSQRFHSPCLYDIECLCTVTPQHAERKKESETKHIKVILFVSSRFSLWLFFNVKYILSLVQTVWCLHLAGVYQWIIIFVYMNIGCGEMAIYCHIFVAY